MSATPYLSIVSFARNDTYTPTYRLRADRSLQYLVRQLERHRVPTEIVIVEWNPPSEKPLLADELSAPPGSGFVTLRYIAVDSQYHKRFEGWEHRGIHGSAAANVGLRRSRGRFVLFKHIDTYLAEPLAGWLSKQQARNDAIYRCDRVDIRMDGDDWVELPDDRIIGEFSRHIVGRQGRLSHSEDWKIRDLHTNASGDFMLMAAEKWAAIRGFPHDPTVLCLDADSIALHAAAAHGAQEICLPDDCVVYKLTHGSTYVARTRTVWRGWQQKLDRYLVEKKKRDLAARLRILLDYPRRRVVGVESILAPSIERLFVSRAERFARNDTSLTTNDKNWGLAGVTLPEKIVTRAVWDTP